MAGGAGLVAAALGDDPRNTFFTAAAMTESPTVASTVYSGPSLPTKITLGRSLFPLAIGGIHCERACRWGRTPFGGLSIRPDCGKGEQETGRGITIGGMGTLILLRHGESVWNARQLFTGWTDVGLTSTENNRPNDVVTCCARRVLCPTRCTARS